MFRVLILAALSSGVFSQIEQNTNCVTPSVFPIDVDKFLGTWYQIERIPNSDENGDCSTTTFATNSNTDGTMTNTEVVNKTEKARKGVISKTESDFVKGKFKVTYEDNSTYDYYLLASDYDNFAVLYSCKDVSESSSNVWAWKISKSKNLTAASEFAINSLFNATHHELATAEWRKTRQDGCEGNGSVTLVYSPILALTTLLFMVKDVIY